MSKGDQLLKAFSILNSHNANALVTYGVEARWIDELNPAVADIESASGRSLTGSHVPGSAVDSQSAYDESGRWCERSILMHKIDAPTHAMSRSRRLE